MQSLDSEDWLALTDTAATADPLVTDRRGLAAVLGFAPKEIDRLLREGLPSYGERRAGVASTYRIPDVVRWLLDRNGDSMDAAKRRSMDATARKREVEAARLEGRFVDIAEVESAIRDQLARLQGELLAIPARLPADVRELAAAEISGAINRMAWSVGND